LRTVFFGAPGAGKGTQAGAVCERYGVPHVSTGDIFRAAMKDGSELGGRVKSYVESGRLVPDELTVAVVARRLAQADCAAGFLLDGFPRTVAQAEMLEKLLRERGLKLDAVVSLAADEDTLVERLTGRRMCTNKACGANYHVKFMPPKRENVCDKCGSALYQRPDDTEETIRGRLAVFREQTQPLIEWYRNRGVLREVDGAADVERVRAEIAAVLGEAAGR